MKIIADIKKQTIRIILLLEPIKLWGEMISHKIESRKLIIKISRNFVFNCYREFRSAYQVDKNSIRSIEVNLYSINKMDSSALGMLLQLHEYHDKKDLSILIKDCDSEVMSILYISGFNKLFTLHDNSSN